MPDPTKRRFVPKPGVPETSRRVNREEKDWRGYSVLAYDGLMPTQIVRRITESDDHLDPWEATDLPRRVDARPDTDDRRFDGETQQTDPDLTVDERRYVADPGEGKHVFPGLWTGGPVRFTSDKRSGGREITQVLTRTFCAGHGYVVNSNGDVIPVIADSSVEGGWRALGSETSVIGFEDGGRPLNRDGTPVEISEGTVREFATAEEALMRHRPALDSKMTPYMVFRTDIPGSFVRQVFWREFTHESIPYLDALGKDRARLGAVVRHHFKESVAAEVLDAACRVDRETNTVVFTASLLYQEAEEPEDIDELLTLPRLEGPCSRETLRAFGWNQFKDGEGYKYTHVFTIPNLKDTPEVRAVIERPDPATGKSGFLLDSEAIPLLFPEAFATKAGVLHAEALAAYNALPEETKADPAAARAALDEDMEWCSDQWPSSYALVSAMVLAGTPWPSEGWTPEQVRAGVLVRPEITEQSDENLARVTALLDGPAGSPWPWLDENRQIDGTGRFWCWAQTPPREGQAWTRVKAPWYRILLQKISYASAQTGLMDLQIVCELPEWHGGDDGEDGENGGRRMLVGVSSPEGYGVTETRVVPSANREAAVGVMLGIEAEDTYEHISSKRQTEGADGHSDVTFERRRLWDFLGNSDGHTPDFVNLDGNPFNAPVYRHDPNSNDYSLEWSFVAPEKTQELVDRARKYLGGNPTVTVTHHPDGYDIVRVSGKGREPVHVEEWCVAADWYSHETLEQWIGVTLSFDAQTGRPTGFYTEYLKNSDGSYALDANGNLIPVQTSLVPFAEIRGDLDANWMCSDPQSTDGTVRSVPTLWATTGKDGGGSGGSGDGKILLAGATGDDVTHNHGDKHGNGWSNSAWVDPDFGTGDNSQGNTADKKRGHSIAKISPRRNEDGTYSLSITRVYPHQRYWEYELPQTNSRGDERTVTVMCYRNWPSRKAIKADIVNKITAKVSGSDSWSDGWGISGGISVNAFGLVDAPHMTLAPSWGNSKRVARAETVTESNFEIVCSLEKTHTMPLAIDGVQQPDSKTDGGVDGFWWRVRADYVYSGITTSKAEAATEYRKPGLVAIPGSKGVQRTNRKTGVQSHWSWHKIYYYEFSPWYKSASTEFGQKAYTYLTNIGYSGPIVAHSGGLTYNSSTHMMTA